MSLPLRLLLALALAGCAAQPRAFGPVGSPDAARAAALFLTSLEGPVVIVGEPAHGQVRELYRGPVGMCADEEGCRARDAQLQRLGWRVNLTGFAPGSDCPRDACPLVQMHQILIIDELDGSALRVIESEGEIGL